MALSKITEADLLGKGVYGQADVPGLSASEMQQKVEEIVRGVVIPKFNENVELTCSKKDLAGAQFTAGAVSSVFGRAGDISAAAGDYGAEKIAYGNAGSGLAAGNVQGAINELASGLSGKAAADRTLELSDAGKDLVCANGSAITVTVPLYASAAFPLDTEIVVFRAGAGAVTVAFASGVTVWCRESAYGIADRYSSVLLKKRAADNTWSLEGNIG